MSELNSLFAVFEILVAAVPAAAINQGITAYPVEFFAAAQPTNAREMLDRLPGFTFSGGEGVRGYEGAAGNVLVGGQRPASKTDSLDSILRRIQTSSVARIEVIRGGAPGIDMQGQSVLANIVLKTDSNLKAQVSVANTFLPRDGRNVPQARLIASGGSESRAWELGLVAGNYIDDRAGDGPNIQYNSGLVPVVTARSQATGGGSTYQATGAYELPLAGGRLRLSGSIGRQLYDVDVTNRIIMPAAAVERFHAAEDADSLEFGLRFSRAIATDTSLEAVALRRSNDDLHGERSLTTGATTLFNQHARTGETIGRLVLKRTVSPRLSLELGAEGAANTLRNSLAYSINGVAFRLPSANVSVTEDRYEVFAKTVWSPTQAWTVEGSVRQERSNISSTGDTVLAKSLTFTKPRLALTWAPNPANQVRFRVEREVGQLNFKDFSASSSLNNGVVTAGNPNLTPEQAWVTELAWERQFLEKGAAVLQARHFVLTDVIDRAPIFTATRTYDSPANIGVGTKDEISAQLTLPFDKFGAPGVQLQGSSTWRWSQVTDPTTHLKREISGLPPQDWKVNLTWDLPRKKLSLGLSLMQQSLVTKYRLDQIESTKIRPILSAVLNWNPRPNWIVLVAIGDITDRAIRYTHDQYAGPRSRNGLGVRDDRVERVGPTILLGLKKTFG